MKDGKPVRYRIPRKKNGQFTGGASSAPAASSAPTAKMKRCPIGKKRNPTTKNCDDNPKSRAKKVAIKSGVYDREGKRCAAGFRRGKGGASGKCVLK